MCLGWIRPRWYSISLSRTKLHTRGNSKWVTCLMLRFHYIVITMGWISLKIPKCSNSKWRVKYRQSFQDILKGLTVLNSTFHMDGNFKKSFSHGRWESVKKGVQQQSNCASTQIKLRGCHADLSWQNIQSWRTFLWSLFQIHSLLAHTRPLISRKASPVHNHVSKSTFQVGNHMCCKSSNSKNVP